MPTFYKIQRVRDGLYFSCISRDDCVFTFSRRGRRFARHQSALDYFTLMNTFRAFATHNPLAIVTVECELTEFEQSVLDKLSLVPQRYRAIAKAILSDAPQIARVCRDMAAQQLVSIWSTRQGGRCVELVSRLEVAVLSHPIQITLYNGVRDGCPAATAALTDHWLASGLSDDMVPIMLDHVRNSARQNLDGSVACSLASGVPGNGTIDTAAVVDMGNFANLFLE